MISQVKTKRGLDKITLDVQTSATSIGIVKEYTVFKFTSHSQLAVILKINPRSIDLLGLLCIACDNN